MTDKAPDDLAYLSIAEASRLIADGNLSPVDLVQTILNRIEEIDERVRAYALVLADAALADARAAEARAVSGQRRGPLDGIPIAVKDIFDIAGVVTSGNSPTFRDRIAAEDATSVRLLREAGAILVGKTNLNSELAVGIKPDRQLFPPTRNPWALDRDPGGSSSGSAAGVTSGQCFGALGTDTMGSIRAPSALCGVTGLKPTFGLVGRGGVLPYVPSLECVGPMARSAQDCALLLNALAAHDPRDPDSIRRPREDYTAGIGHGIEGLRVAVIPSLMDDCQADVEANFRRAVRVLSELGAKIGECEPLDGFPLWRDRLRTIFRVEAAATYRHILENAPESITESIRSRLLVGLETRAVDYVAATRLRKEVERRFEEAFLEWDALVAPSWPNVAVGFEDEGAVGEKATVFNDAHVPLITVPNGFDGDGLPTGLLIVGPKFADGLILRIAASYQQATDFHLQRPVLS